MTRQEIIALSQRTSGCELDYGHVLSIYRKSGDRFFGLLRTAYCGDPAPPFIVTCDSAKNSPEEVYDDLKAQLAELLP